MEQRKGRMMERNMKQKALQKQYRNPKIMKNGGGE